MSLRFDSRIYVAGHRGLLGSAVVRALRKEGFGNLLCRTHSELDLLDAQATGAFFRETRPEYVFLCAAKVGGIQANAKAPGDFFYRNTQIQCNVIEAARQFGVRKLLFVGSSCIYPRDTPVPIREEQLLTGPLEPTNEGYAMAKLGGIKMCEFYRRQYGCDFISAIPTNLYGVGDNYDLESAHLLPALIRKVHEARAAGRDFLEVWGSGEPRREFMLSDDCAGALLHLMRHHSAPEPVNVGTGEDESVLELARTVCGVLDVKLEFRLDRSKPDGMYRKLLDVSRLRSLGWRHQYTLRQGIAIAHEDFIGRVL